MAGLPTLLRAAADSGVPQGAPESALVTPPTRDTTEPKGEYYDPRYQTQTVIVDLSPAFLTVGMDVVAHLKLPFTARGFFVDNLSAVQLKIIDANNTPSIIAAGVINSARSFAAPTDTVTININAGALPSSALVVFIFTEAPVIPHAGFSATAAAGGGGGPVTAIAGAFVDGSIVTIGTTTDTAAALTLVGLLKAIKAAVQGVISVALSAALPAGTNVIGHVIADTGSTTAVTALPALPTGANVIGHVIADTGSTTAVTALPSIPAGTNMIGSASERAAINTANAQQTSTAAAATLLAARATRKKATIRNTDAANSVWIGVATVTIANGGVLKPNESRDYFGQSLLQIIDNGAHAVVDVFDYFD